MNNYPRDGWKNLEQPHRMGVSWGQIWAIIGAVVLMAVFGLGVTIFMGKQNSKMIEKKIDELNKKANLNQNDVQKKIQDDVDQKLREAGIDLVQQ